MAKTDFNGWDKEIQTDMMIETVNWLEGKVDALQHLVVGLASIIEEISPNHSDKVGELLEAFDREDDE